MKPLLENIPRGENSSLAIKRAVVPYIQIPLHFHPEFEIVYIYQGKGKRFVGDCIEDFQEGDLVLLGSNLPHFWKNSKEYYKGDPSIQVDVFVIHFLLESFGKDFFLTQEMNGIKELLDQSKYGLRITGETRKRVAEKMVNCTNWKNAQKIIELLDILNDMQEHPKDIVTLSNSRYTESALNKHSHRMNRVFMHISENYDRVITLLEIAEIANMNPSSFCRYFKQLTGKSFSTYLNEIRINYGCKLLVNEDYSITEIAYRCGFNSPSYFNKQFKKIIGKTALEYLRNV